MSIADLVYLQSLAKKQASEDMMYYQYLSNKVASDPSYLYNELATLESIISDCDDIIAKCASDDFAIKIAKRRDQGGRTPSRIQMARITEAREARELAKTRYEIAKTLAPDALLVADKKDPSRFIDLNASGAHLTIPKHDQPKVNIGNKSYVVGNLPVNTNAGAVKQVIREGGQNVANLGLNPSQVKKMQELTGVLNTNMSAAEMMERLNAAKAKGTEALAVGMTKVDASGASNSTKRKFKSGKKTVLQSPGIERSGQTTFAADQTRNVTAPKVVYRQVKERAKAGRDAEKVKRAIDGLLAGFQQNKYKVYSPVDALTPGYILRHAKRPENIRVSPSESLIDPTMAKKLRRLRMGKKFLLPLLLGGGAIGATGYGINEYRERNKGILDRLQDLVS